MVYNECYIMNDTFWMLQFECYVYEYYTMNAI